MTDYNLPYTDLVNLVPQNLRNPMIRSLIDNLFNRFLTSDEAVPLYGYVGRKPVAPDDQTPKVPQLDVERDINALTPVLSFKVGSEVHSFTVQDLVRKAGVLGISEDQSQWLYSQGNNYAPPIDYDKFTNFFNYYWIAGALPVPPDLSWNPTVAPEFYVVATPQPTDLDKLNVKTATSSSVVLTGTGFSPLTWTVTCTAVTLTDISFTIQANGALTGFAPGEDLQSFSIPVLSTVANPGPYPTVTNAQTFSVASSANPLLTFNVIRDVILDNSGGPYQYESFVVGDSFLITAPFISSTHNVSFSGGTGQKGKLGAIDSLDTYQTISGVLLKENDRVLVRHGSASIQGIYVVSPGAWVRASDFTLSTAAAGARVFVTNGVFANNLYTSTTSGGFYTWSLTTTNTVSNTNDWQEGNFWVKRDDLSALNVDPRLVVQATRPIIEFSANLQLNVRVGTDGLPTDAGGTVFEQRKTEFNQAPLYDLYRYDGTHARKVSPIFFYVEDPTANIDVVLQRRVKQSSNLSADFLFSHGLVQASGALLFYKDRSNALHTIWHPGYSQTTIVDQEFSGTGNGTLVATPGTDAFSAQQIWTLTAITSTTFTVLGSKVSVLPAPYDVLTVGTPYSNGLFNATITAGSTPFASGDTFKFRVGNFESTRYVYRDANEALHDRFGGPDLDVNKVGAWQVPRMFFHNVGAENVAEVPEGTLYSHFRGILANQLEATSLNRAFGGSIKLWSEQQNLLASLLMQRAMTPVSMIDLAERAYGVGLNTITDIYFTRIMEYFSTVEVLSRQSDVGELLDFILAIRAKDEDVRTVLYDSTSPVVGFPATLPQLGVTPLVQPGVKFDNELGVELMIHHDGHASAPYTQTPEFRDRLFSSKLMIKRSDGNSTSVVGSFTTIAPAQPYKGLVWLYPGTDTQIRVFDVVSDQMIAPPATGLVVGDYWYQRGANALSVWDGTLWQPEVNLLAPWITIDMAELLNDVLMETEQRLYDGISSEQRTYFTDTDVTNALSGSLSVQLQRELASWAAVNGFDPTAPDYVSTNAFTWNYSSASVGAFAALSTSSVPARWFNVLQAHHKTFGSSVVPTARPNLEPWKLLGNATKPGTWDAAHRATVTPNDVLSGGFITGNQVTAVRYSPTPVMTTLSGLPTVDGITMTAGQILLLTSEGAMANNGPWVVSSGAWARAGTALLQNTVFDVLNGTLYSGTRFVLLANVPTVNVDPVSIEQIRLWKPTMWATIKLARPSLRLSVDVNRDALLPPYVNVSMPWAAEALSTTLVPSPADAYSYGEGSPVETVFTKSLEYRYSLARALFRHDPLSFLGNCWGFEWVEVDGILYDGYDMSVPGHQRFRLHGQANPSLVRRTPFTVSSITGPASYVLTVKHDAYTATRRQSWTVSDEHGVLIGHLNEGITGTLSGAGYVLSSVRIEDEGEPFRVGDKFTITGNADGSGMSVLFEPAAYHQIHGFGQTFAHALRASNIDTNQGYAIAAYRGWDVNLGYRAGGLVSTDDLRLFTDSESLPESAYALRFKRNPFAKDLWVQGLRVTVVQIGTSTTNAVNATVPTADCSDWIFRIEGYNTRYLTLTYVNLDTNGEFSTFNALNGEHTTRAWKHYSNVLGKTESQLPLTITGLQNVVTFLFGYVKALELDGWVFNDSDAQNIDASTGRVRNWQLEIEQLIDRVYGGIELGQGHVLNPFIDRVWIEQETGLLAPFHDVSLFDITAHPAVFDTLGIKLKTDDLTILRARGKSQISPKTPMFCVHAQVDEYEHLFVLNNLSSPSTNDGLIYDPFSGARIATLKLNGRRQGGGSLRPEFGGHYLVGDKVKRNLQSSTDKIAQYYDANHVFEDELSTRHALALLGFSPKEYMSDLDLNSRTQFNFWRGLIQMKGTNASIDAFLNNDRFEDAKVDEYWAYKVAEYGDSRSKIFPELKLTVDDTLQQFTKLIFNIDHGSQPAGYEAFAAIQPDDETRWFTLGDLSDNPVNFEARLIGVYRDVGIVNAIISLPFLADALVAIRGTFSKVNANTIKILTVGTVDTDGTNFEISGYGPSTPKFNPIKLLNYVDAELVEEIPHWHPAVGQHTPTALESVNVISSKDPARYNMSTLVVGNSNYDPLRMWGAKEIGRVWWDTTNLEYLPYSDDTIFQTVDERLSRWGTLADYASVDVVEWVESAVQPAEYNARATIDANNADLDSRTRAEGTVYGAKTYSRERVWSVYPILWSHTAVALEAAHPQFLGSYDSNLTFTNDGLAYLESKTFLQCGIAAGSRLGAWQQDASATRPLSEYIVLDKFTKFVTGTPSTASFTQSTYSPSSTLGAVIDLVTVKHTQAIGQLNFVFDATELVGTQLRDSDGLLTNEWDIATYVRVMLNGNAETFLVRNDRGTGSTRNAAIASATFTSLIGQVWKFAIPAYGLQLNVTAQSAGVHNTTMLAAFIEAALGVNVRLYDAVQIEEVCALDPTKVLEKTGLVISSTQEFSNDSVTPDPSYSANDGVGWRAWTVPTQAELDADSRAPNGSWKPYVGIPFSYDNVAVPIAVVQDAKNSVYTLNDGSTVTRYTSTWAQWSELKQLSLRKVALATGNIVFSNSDPVNQRIPTGVSADRISVYVNGVAQLAGTYALVGTTLTVFNIQHGHQVVVIVRSYVPSQAELAFDPIVEDDTLVQRQYKIDYQYAAVPVRDTGGAITTTKYYFWVKNRTAPAPKNNLSIKAVSQLLTEGPSQYLTFQHIGGSAPTLYYDAIAIAGLGYTVTRDNTFKLRFTRNFTLRDDPNELDLKDTHVEWSLIRPGQRTKIPEALWLKLVNTSCGADTAGNALPAPRRASYDERNGTRTRFGFGNDQVLAPTELVNSTLEFTILNTRLLDESGVVPIPDYMLFLDFEQSSSWFSTPANSRNTLTKIWNEGKVSQINELFFAVLEDICASNFELTDLFKTSRLSAYSIKAVRAGPTNPTYE